MEVYIYLEKWTVHRIMFVANDVMCTVHFFGAYRQLWKIITVIPYHLIFHALKMLQSTSAVNVANCVAIDFANNVLSVEWMEVYPFRINQSKSLINEWQNLPPLCPESTTT